MVQMLWLFYGWFYATLNGQLIRTLSCWHWFSKPSGYSWLYHWNACSIWQDQLLFNTRTHPFCFRVHIYIYIYIYIIIHRQTILLYHSSSVLLDTWDARSWDQNLADFTLARYSTTQHKRRDFNTYVSPFVLFTCICLIATECSVH